MLRIGNDILITVIDCNGEPVAVFSQQQEGESQADFEARHLAAVEAAKARCESGGAPSSSAPTWVNKNGEVVAYIPGDDLEDSELAARESGYRTRLD